MNESSPAQTQSQPLLDFTKPEVSKSIYKVRMDFDGISQKVLSVIADKRNKNPRKSLNYQIPYQVF